MSSAFDANGDIDDDRGVGGGTRSNSKPSLQTDETKMEEGDKAPALFHADISSYLSTPEVSRLSKEASSSVVSNYQSTYVSGRDVP